MTLVDSDEVNGFSIAGGHIYIHRKLAAVAKSDDELAGVIGHEIGHIISHQFAFETRALDEFDGTMVGEALGGALVVAQIGNPDMNQQKHIFLPLSPLPSGQSAALSKDGKYLALSTLHRGGVWDVATGKQLAVVHGFTDASWDDADTVYMDVPKDMDVERHITQISMTTRVSKDLSYKVTDETHMRYGRLTDWKQDDKKKTWTLSQYDPATDKTQWTRSFPDRYFTYTASYGSRDLIFSFPLSSHTAKDALKANEALESEAQSIKNKSLGRLIQILDGKNGEEDGSLVVELPPNYAGTDGLNRAGDLLYVAGVDDRTTVYSIASGKRIRDLIGYVMALDPSTNRVFTANRVGEGVVYDAAGAELAHYQLGNPIRFALFREGAVMVTVITADQKVRTMKVASVSPIDREVARDALPK